MFCIKEGVCVCVNLDRVRFICKNGKLFLMKVMKMFYIKKMLSV